MHRKAELALNRQNLPAARAACLEILERDPAHADAYFLLGMIVLAAGSAGKAAALVERATALDPRRAEYHAQLARCRALLREEGQAARAAERALELGVSDPATLDTLGVVWSRLGAHERAVEAFRKAVVLAPDKPGIRHNLAASLRFLGRFEEAEGAYEAALQVAPDFYRAHSALAELGTHTRAANHIERLQHALGRVGDDADAELHLRHALAKEHEDCGDYAAAFEHLTIGKRRKRATLRYSVDDDLALFDRIQRLFTPALLARAAAGHASEEPIFVVGMPRTGTTLVERILSSHSAVTSAGELQNFAVGLKRAAATRSNRVLDEETLERSLGVDFAALGKTYIESTRPMTGRAAHFVDKMPLNFFYIGFIRLALPRAKIVCLRRHPLDTCLSNFRQLFALGFSYYNYAFDLADIGRYYIAFDRLMRHWRALLPDGLLEIGYERLVADQESETRKLLEFCGLPWEERCLEFHRNPSPVATASAVQVRRRLYPDSIGRWRRYGGLLEPLRARLSAAGIELD